MSVRQLIIQLLPKRFLDLYGKMRKKKSPKYTRYIGASNSVLQCVIAYNKYGGYCIPQSGYFHLAPQTIFKGHVWEKETTEFIISKVNY